MLLLQVIILSLFLSYGCAQIHLKQAQLSITRAQDKTARIDCEASGIENFGSAIIHWYRHRPGEAPERILYISSAQPVFDKDSDKKKFNCDKKLNQLISTLTVNGIAPNDGATYYCAYWDGTVGTRLSIRDPNLQPSVSETQAQLKPVRMLLVQVLIVASIWSYGAAQVQLTQDQLSITRNLMKTVRIDCKVSGINVGDAYIHWYRQRPGEAPEWILYFKSHAQNEQSNFDKDKFSVDKTTEKSTYGYTQITLIQTPLSVTRAVTKTARMACRISGQGFNLNSAYIHWYRQRPGEAPKRILYIGSGTISKDEGFNSEKFTASNDVSASTANLRVDQLTLEDAATYYCATWDRTVLESHRQPVQKPTLHSEPQPFKCMKPEPSLILPVNLKPTAETPDCFLQYDRMNSIELHQRDTSSWIKYFGTGTKLVVSDIPAKLDYTKFQVLPPSPEQDGKVSYMCLIQDFYPDVIKVTWKDEDKKNAENNAVHEEIWSPGNNKQSYSISSWLTIDKNSNKNYRCHYQHESKEDFVPTASPDKHVVSQTIGSCINKPENGTTLSTDITEHFMHRTASLIYIVLLLKSSMYYVIVLFFIYRMQSPIKHRGKKPYIQAKLDSTKIQVLPLSTEQDGKVSYMCLIEDFYPNVIKVTWEDEKKNAEKNAVHEEIWPPGDNRQSYSMSSWLTVDKNSNKNYHCNYKHEKDTRSVPIKSPDTFSDTTVMPQTTRGCIKNAENGTMLSTDITDSFIHRTAYLIYIVLLLKSSMYYVIVLFFIYRMQSPIKRQGKKP
nr:uncharacterized protein LOC101942985 [Chrysemys picta bellii]